jgi:hypothetical protein
MVMELLMYDSVRHHPRPVNSPQNCRIHLTCWAVTALAEKHRSSNHRPRLPGPRRPQPAGDANVMRLFHSAAQAGAMTILLLVAVLCIQSCAIFSRRDRQPDRSAGPLSDSLIVLPGRIDPLSFSWEFLVAGCNPEDIEAVSLILGSQELQPRSHIFTSNSSSLWEFFRLPSLPMQGVQVAVREGGSTRKFPLLVERSLERPPQNCESMTSIGIEVRPGTVVLPGRSAAGFSPSQIQVSDPLLRELLDALDVATVVRWSDLVGTPVRRSGEKVVRLDDRYSLLFRSPHQVLSIWEILSTSPVIQGVYWDVMLTDGGSLDHRPVNGR